MSPEQRNAHPEPDDNPERQRCRIRVANEALETLLGHRLVFGVTRSIEIWTSQFALGLRPLHWALILARPRPPFEKYAGTEKANGA